MSDLCSGMLAGYATEYIFKVVESSTIFTIIFAKAINRKDKHDIQAR